MDSKKKNFVWPGIPTVLFAVAFFDLGSIPKPELLWGIQNQGQKISASVDHFRKIQIQGIPGEDIQKPAIDEHELQSIRVAVIDSGIDLDHPSLEQSISEDQLNVVKPKTSVQDTDGHGTHVAGIILQVAPNVEIIPIKVTDRGPRGPIQPSSVHNGGETALAQSVAKGIDFAIEKNAQVINLSLAWPISFPSQLVKNAVKRAKSKGILIVSSAGNDRTEAHVFPCSYSEVTCVGAHDPKGNPTWFSNFGPMVDVYAPGFRILSLIPTTTEKDQLPGFTGFGIKDGTSMAAPFVSGAYALLLGLGFTPEESERRILSHLREHKRLDLNRALTQGEQPFFTLLEKSATEVAATGQSDYKFQVQVQENGNSKNSKSKVQIFCNGHPTQHTWDRERRIYTSECEVKAPGLDENFQIQVPISIQVNGVFVQQFQRTLRFYRSLSSKTIPTDLYSDTRVIESQRIPEEIFPIEPINDSFHSLLKFPMVNKEKIESTYQVLFHQKLWDLRNEESTSCSLDRLLYAVQSPDFYLWTLSDSGKGETLFCQWDSRNDFRLIKRLTVNAQVTLPNLPIRWIQTKSQYRPFWISVGLTPEKDKKKFDPWNPKPKDPKIPRIYFLDDEFELRQRSLPDSEVPIAILGEHEILISRIEGFRSQHFTMNMDDSPDTAKKRLPRDQQRMLLGALSSPWVSESSKQEGVILSTASTPGFLRATRIHSNFGMEDQMITTGDVFNPLREVVFALTHSDQVTQTLALSNFDYWVFDSKDSKPRSISLNRFSYLPQFGAAITGTPMVLNERIAIHRPAGPTNQFTSEVITIGRTDLNESTVSKLRHRIRASEECFEWAPLKHLCFMSPGQ